MPRSKRIIQAPKADSSAFNKDRPLSKNTLLLNQVRHFQQVEQTLPPEKRTGVKPDEVATEGQASEYLRKMTAILHPRVDTAGGR